MKEFKGKVAVITGAASGIGYALAERCAKEGMKVVLADIEEGALEKAEKIIKAIGTATLAVKTDVSKADDVEALAKKTIDKFGKVHLLFNNAGVALYNKAEREITLDDWEWTLGVNLWGVIYGVHFFVPIMLKQNTECYIVNTSSGAGLLSTPAGGPYSVSKHGVVALSETLYREFEHVNYKIGVSVLCPGFIKTNIFEAARNRPAELLNKFGQKVDMKKSNIHPLIRTQKKLIENGMQPKQVADIVFDAIREKKFYILPNIEQYKPMVQARMEDILQERNPTTLPFPITSK
jgi:NAD(P)-dependent dehydrogenase (short-subunit alcohol dehydrogenase family)